MSSGWNKRGCWADLMTQMPLCKYHVLQISLSFRCQNNVLPSSKYEILQFLCILWLQNCFVCVSHHRPPPDNTVLQLPPGHQDVPLHQVQGVLPAGAALRLEPGAGGPDLQHCPVSSPLNCESTACGTALLPRQRMLFLCKVNPSLSKLPPDWVRMIVSSSHPAQDPPFDELRALPLSLLNVDNSSRFVYEPLADDTRRPLLFRLTALLHSLVSFL